MANTQRFGNFQANGTQIEERVPFETQSGHWWRPLNHAPLTAKEARVGAKQLAKRDKE
jgi:hypothetical protein